MKMKTGNFLDDMFNAQRNVWENGELYETRYKHWEIYEVVDVDYDDTYSEYVVFDERNGWRLCSKPYNTYTLSIRSEGYDSWDDLRAAMIERANDQDAEDRFRARCFVS